MREDLRPEPGVKYTHAGGVVYRLQETTREVLLVSARMDRTVWVLPKGHIERGETPEQTAVREVLEEAGVTARLVEFLTASRQVVRGRRQVIAYYLMEMVADGGRGEGRLLDWLGEQKAVRRASHDESKIVLTQAYARLADRFPR